MNPLVEYLEENHNPGGNAVQHVRVSTLLDETMWTKEEIFEMAFDAKQENYVSITMKTGTRTGEYTPDGLEIIGYWNELYRRIGNNR